MMLTTRRVCFLMVTLGLFGWLVLGQSSEPRAEAQKMAKDDPKTPKMSASVGIAHDPEIQRTMERVWGLCRDENWNAAVKDIQTLLNRPTDSHVYRLDKKGGFTEDAVSIRFEVNRLLGQMPADGLLRYEDQSGPIASRYLEDALKADSHEERIRLLEDTVLCYMHTKAGARALEYLATNCLERGDHQKAGLLFKKYLVELKNVDPITSPTLLKAALAFSRYDDKSVNREEVVRLLLSRADRDGGVRLGPTLTLSKDQIDSELKVVHIPLTSSVAESPIFRGNTARAAQGVGGDPDLTPVWIQTMLPDREAWVKTQVDDGTKNLELKGLPVVPAFYPVGSNGRLVFRTYNGLHVVNVREPLLKNGEPNLERVAWGYTDGGAEAIGSDPNKKGSLAQWQQQYNAAGGSSLIFENPINGSVTTDGVRGFLVDDLILPPLIARQMGRFGPPQPQGPLAGMASRNVLKCYNLETMKLSWDLGGPIPTGNPALDKAVQGSFFLGAPLPIGKKLYVLNEKENELRLLCLECRDRTDEKVPTPPDLIFVQKLVNVRDLMGQDFNRRIHTAHLACGEGMMVCPTNAGALLGVDLLSRSLVWIHRYREEPVNPAPLPNPRLPQPAANFSLANQWKDAPPAIVDGKVLFTSWDSNALHCLRLRDGELLWRVARGPDDVYFAGVFDGKALIVGKNDVRAYHIHDEVEKQPKPAWSIANTGMPTGQGVASANTYYVPVKKAGKEGRPGIVAIDVTKGTVISTMAARTDKANGQPQEVGNLIFYEGQLISQTVDTVVGYPHAALKAGQ